MAITINGKFTFEIFDVFMPMLFFVLKLHFLIYIDVLILCRKFELMPIANF